MIKALLTGAAALCLAALPASADTFRTVSGSTAIRLNTAVLTPFFTNPAVNVVLTTNGAAKLGKTGVLSLPIVGGGVDVTDSDGEIIHSGGIKFSRVTATGLKTVVFTNFMLELKVSEPVTPPVPATATYTVTAIVSDNGNIPPAAGRIVLFDIPTAPTLTKAKKLVLNASALNLSTAATTLLNTTLVLPSSPAAPPLPASPAFTPGTNFGAAVFQAAFKKI